MYITVHIVIQVPIFSSIGPVIRSRIAGLYVDSLLSF